MYLGGKNESIFGAHPTEPTEYTGSYTTVRHYRVKNIATNLNSYPVKVDETNGDLYLYLACKNNSQDEP
jgi:hypothetical protein